MVFQGERPGEDLDVVVVVRMEYCGEWMTSSEPVKLFSL